MCVYIYIYILDSLVAQDAGEEALGVASVQCVGVGVAEGARLELDAHLPGLWRINLRVRECLVNGEGGAHDPKKRM